MTFQKEDSLGPLKLPEKITYEKVTTLKDKRFLQLGPHGLMVTILTPLQKFRYGKKCRSIFVLANIFLQDLNT